MKYEGCHAKLSEISGRFLKLSLERKEVEKKYLLLAKVSTCSIRIRINELNVRKVDAILGVLKQKARENGIK